MHVYTHTKSEGHYRSVVHTVRAELTFAVKFATAKWNFSLVFVPASCPAFATLPKAPFNHVVPAVMYLQRINGRSLPGVYH